MSTTTEPGRERYRISIDGVDRISTDPVLTGRQILQLAGRGPVEEHLVYFLTPRRILEDISLEETVDLRHPGNETFLTFRADRSFRFELNSIRQDWGMPEITEPTLRKLAGVGDDYEVWLERTDAPDQALRTGETVRLDSPGVERFRTEVARPLVHVVDLNTNADVSFRARWSDTLQQVWDQAYRELGESRRENDVLECEDGTSLMANLGSTLEQLREQNICTDRRFQIRGNTGGA